MATVAEMFVEIGADASGFEAETQQVQNELKATQEQMRQMASMMGVSTVQMQSDWKNMSNAMKSELIGAAESLQPLKQAQMEAQHGFRRMAMESSTFRGTTSEFINDAIQMGAQYKKATDALINGNRMGMASMLQQIGMMNNMTSVASRIEANYTRMNNPLLTVNNGLLRAVDSMNRFAMSGSSAQLALEALGPTASMKDLNNYMRMINTQVMNFPIVFGIAAVGAGLFYGKLHEVNMAMNPEYASSFNNMMEKLGQTMQPLVNVFAELMIPVYDFIAAIAEAVVQFQQAHPNIAKFVAAIMLLIPALTLLLSPLAIGIGWFAGLRAILFSLAPIITPIISGFAAMGGTVLLVAAIIVGVVAALIYAWNNFEGFRNFMMTAWEGVKAAVMVAWTFIQQQIQNVANAVVPFVMSKWQQIQQFFQQNGSQIMEAAGNVWNAIKGVIQAVMPAIQVILGVAWEIIKALVISTWEAIKNVINGAINVILGIIKFFSALFTGDWKGVWEAVKQILSGAVELIWGLINLWFIGKFISGFKAFGTAAKSLFTSVWNAIKTVFQNAWTGIGNIITTAVNFIKGFLNSGFNAIKSVITTVLNAIKTVFTTVWNGIKTVATTVVNAIKSAIQSGFNAIKSVVTTVVNAIKTHFTSQWNMIKSVATTVVNGIKSAVQSGFNAMKSVVTSVMNGIKSTFTSVWNAVKSAASSGINAIVSTIRNGLNQALNFVKGLGSSFMAAGKGLIDMMASGIANAAGKVIEKVKDLAGKVRDFLPFSPAKTGPLSDLDKLDFGGPIADSISDAEPMVQKMMNDLVAMPDFEAPEPLGQGDLPQYSNSFVNNNRMQQQVVIELDGRTLARGTLPYLPGEIRTKTGMRF